MALTEERRNEIAWKISVSKMKDQGISNLQPENFQEKIVKMTTELGISQKEAFDFIEELISTSVKEMFDFAKNRMAGS